MANGAAGGLQTLADELDLVVGGLQGIQCGLAVVAVADL